MRVGLLTRLLTKRLWLAGIGADVAGYVLQFLALGIGSLALVQPLLVSGLLLALPLAAALDHRRLRPSEWAAAGAVCVGLATFLVVASPARGRATASATAWIVMSVALLIPAAALSLRRRPRALSAAAGLVYAYTAALTKTTAHLLSVGIGTALRSWEPYALVAAALFGMLLAQSAFQSGDLDASLPALTVVDPIASVVVGALVFHESMTASPAAVVVEVAAVVGVVVGVFRLGAATHRAPRAAAV